MEGAVSAPHHEGEEELMLQCGNPHPHGPHPWTDHHNLDWYCPGA